MRTHWGNHYLITEADLPHILAADDGDDEDDEDEDEGEEEQHKEDEEEEEEEPIWTAAVGSESSS
jgi:hypothetical protein